MKDFVRIVVVSPDKRVLALAERRTNPKRIWNLPGGKVDEGETPIQAAYRERGEELGIYRSGLNFMYSEDFDFDGEPWRGHFYWCNLLPTRQLKVEPDIYGYGFFGLDGLKALSDEGQGDPLYDAALFMHNNVYSLTT